MNKPATCARCSADLTRTPFTVSRFSEDEVCIPCVTDERDAPGYQAAYEAEALAVKNGDFNFPGVGLSQYDRAFLAERLRARAGAPAKG